MKKTLLLAAVLLPFSSHHCLAESSGCKPLNTISNALTILTPGASVISSLIMEQPVQAGGYILELAGQELFVEGAKASICSRPKDWSAVLVRNAPHDGKAVGLATSQMFWNASGRWPKRGIGR